MCRSGTGRALSACVRLLLRSMSEGRVYVQAEPFNRKIYTSVRCPVVRARHCLHNLSISLPAFLSISYFLDTFLSIFFPPVFPDLLFSHRNFLFPQQVFLFNLNIFLYHFHGPGSQDFVCDLNSRLSMFLDPIPWLSFSESVLPLLKSQQKLIK